MPDYEKLKEARANPRPTEPLDIFARLVKPEDIRDLSPAQADVLMRWYEKRNDRDIVMKLNTGAGKTLVGLIAAKSTMNERGGSVLYLCPNNQLVDQTIAKANEVRIAAERYVPGSPLAPKFLAGEAIMVATYAALFNGHSRFGVEGDVDYVRVSMVILDDAHVELADLRDQFTLSFSSSRPKDKPFYDELIALLGPYYRQTKPGLFQDVIDGKEHAVLELPYWMWFEVKDAVFEVARRADRIEWPFIRDISEHCHVFVGAGTVSITPIFPMTEMLPTFSNAPRRLFMSATLADDSALAATFALSEKALNATIESKSLTGVSERMILVPGAHGKLNKEAVQSVVRELVADVPASKKGAAVIVPSKARSADWGDIAAFMDSPEKVAAQIAAMQSGENFGPVVFANRYDGMDLKNDACRLLIIDGLPQGRSDYETARGTALVDSSEIAAGLAQRLEQGLGRGARGSKDYCAVLLLGDDLVSWLSNRANWKFMTSSTRAQIGLGEDLTGAIEDAADLKKAILDCVDHDDKWVAYHLDALADRVKAEEPPSASDSPMMIEREAFEVARSGNLAKAVDILAEAAATSAPYSDEYKGWFLQMAARFLWLGGDQTQSIKCQQTAYRLNKRLFRPTAEVVYEPQTGPDSDQAATILEHFNDFRRGNGYIGKVQMAFTKLSGAATYNQFEEALMFLGTTLGFVADRPDNNIGKGPDVLWLTHARTAFVIEAKSKKLDTPLNPAEKGQLLSSCEWFKANYEHWAYTGVIVLPLAIATKKASYGDAHALSFDGLKRLCSATIGALNELRDLPRSSASRIADAAKILSDRDLTSDGLAKYFEGFTVVEDRAGEAVPLPLQ